MSIVYGGKPVVDAQRLYSDCMDATPPIPVDYWLGRANLFDVPRGMEPGRGAVLMTYDDLSAIDGNSGQTLIFWDDRTSTSTTLKNIIITEAHCVVPGAPNDPRNVFLVELADRRIELMKLAISKSYNVRKPDGSGYFDASKNSGSAWTWQTMFANIWGLLGIGSAPTLPFTPNGTPENFDFYGGYAWQSLFVVLDRIGCTVAYDPVADTFTVFQIGTTTQSDGLTAVNGAAGDDALRCWDDYIYRTNRGTRPEKISVVFRRFPGPTDGTDPYYAVEVTLAAATGSVGTLRLEDDLSALGATGTPSNNSALGTRATERAADWLRIFENASYSTVRQYRGFRKGLVKAIGPKYASFGYEDRGSGFRSQVVTRSFTNGFKFMSPLSGSSKPTAVVWVSSATADANGHYPAKLYLPDGAGGRTLGVDVKYKKFYGDIMVADAPYWAQENGTASLSGTDYPLYDGIGCTEVIVKACDEFGNPICNRWRVYGPFQIEEDITCP